MPNGVTAAQHTSLHTFGIMRYHFVGCSRCSNRVLTNSVFTFES